MQEPETGTQNGTVQDLSPFRRKGRAGARARNSRRLRRVRDLALATLALAAATFVSIPGVAQATQDNGAIADLTLASVSPGTLDVSWEAAATAPTDYRVNWARSDESFPSWTDDSANRYPHTTSLRLTDLDEGVEYKVRVRARFYRGGYTSNPWSGPWEEEAWVVAAEPPSGVRSDDDPPVTLLTPPPLIVFDSDDPGEHDDPPVTLLTPPPLIVFDSDDPGGDDDVLVALQQGSDENKLGGNGNERDKTVDIGFPEVVVGETAQHHGHATSFTPGSGAAWYELSSIHFGIYADQGGVIRVAIHGDDTDNPAVGALYSAYVQFDTEDSADLDLDANFADNAILEPGRKYWAVFDVLTGAPSHELYVAPDGAEDAGFESWAIGDSGRLIEYLAADGFTWSASEEGPIEMSFHGRAVSERVLIGAHELRDTADDGPFLRFGTERVTKVWLNLPKGRTYDGTGGSSRIVCEPAFVEGLTTEFSPRLCDRHPDSYFDHLWAGGRSFSTGPNPMGYTITGLGADIDRVNGTVDPRANIYAPEAFDTSDGSRDPQPPVASYQAAGTSASPDRFAPTAGSARFQADPGRTYVAYFSNVGGGYFDMPNASPGADTGGEAGWSLGAPYGSRFKRPWPFGGDSWNLRYEPSKRIPLNVYGWPNPPLGAPNSDPPAPAPTLIGNLDRTSNADGQRVYRQSATDYQIANSFTTGNRAKSYAIVGVQIEITDAANFVGGIRAAIHADDNGSPGASLHEMALLINPQPGLVTFYAPAGTVLNARTTYWLVVDAADTATADHQADVGTTSTAGTPDCRGSAWSLGAAARVRSSATNRWTTESFRVKMAVLGEPVTDPSDRSSEPVCGDLPGDTSTTGRLVVDGAAVRGQHHSSADVDWYAVDLEANAFYQFDVKTGGNLSVYRMRIYDSAGNAVMVTVGSGMNERQVAVDNNFGAGGRSYQRHALPFQPDTAGRYYVSIQAPNGGIAPNRVYALSVQGDDYASGTSTTAVVEVGGSIRTYIMRTEANASSTSTRDFDTIKVALQRNTRYRIVWDVACLHEGIIGGIDDINRPWVLRQTISRETDGWCTDLTIEFTPPTARDYFITVSARGSDFPGASRYAFQGVWGTLTVKRIS
ncbi:choice-of-anchor R domain-containing protein [Candidatus Poriferisodalis sp.]|uniref:choice-of-anchor R domain-containing protein n=1 Tax=Candidatus Poriferisodalis sp. TaxID=3101277 RepID=UPI003B01F259